MALGKASIWASCRPWSVAPIFGGNLSCLWRGFSGLAEGAGAGTDLAGSEVRIGLKSCILSSQSDDVQVTFGKIAAVLKR